MSDLILVVDDEKDLVQLLEYNLRAAGFDTVAAHSGAAALRLVASRKPALVVLDVMLPDVSGTEVCRLVRAGPQATTPIILLTGKSQQQDRIEGLSLGADDYVTKPFSVKELVLRVQAVLRRGLPGTVAGALTHGPIRLDDERHEVSIAGEVIALTPIEYKLLRLLVLRRGRVQSRETLLADVWDLSPELETRTVDTHVKRLREKLGVAAPLLETVRGYGYRLKD